MNDDEIKQFLSRFADPQEVQRYMDMRKTDQDPLIRAQQLYDALANLLGAAEFYLAVQTAAGWTWDETSRYLSDMIEEAKVVLEREQ